MAFVHVNARAPLQGVGTEGLHEGDAAALAALLGPGGHADNDEEVGAEQDGHGDHDEDDAAGAALGGGGGGGDNVGGEDDLFAEEEALGGHGDAAAHHGGDAIANNADPEARLAADPRLDAADLPARQEQTRRWGAAMLRGARVLLSVAADGVLDGVLYVVESPVARLVGDLVPELRDLGNGMLAFAALVAFAARPRAADQGAVYWRTSLVRRARVVLSLAADGVFDIVLYIVNSPVARFFSHLLPGATELGHAIVALAALLAIAARPRALGGGGGAGGDDAGGGAGDDAGGGGEDADAGDQDLAAEDALVAMAVRPRAV